MRIVDDCPACQAALVCDHEIESGSHGYGCLKCGMSGTAGYSWCSRMHGSKGDTEN